jgi:hypothetical protein
MPILFKDSWMFTKTEPYLRLKQIKLIYGDNIKIVVNLKEAEERGVCKGVPLQSYTCPYSHMSGAYTTHRY